jgi:hypothetical protein
METTNSNLLRAVNTIDKVVGFALKWMNSSKTAIRAEFMRVFAGTPPELISHYMDKWDGDFARFYLSSDEGMRRKIFTYYAIPLEPDKFTEVNMALINGRGKVSKFDVFPFESYITHLFYLTAYNNSLELLSIVAPEAFQRVKNKKINMYGNGINWSKAWSICANYDKEKIVEYLFKEA